MANETLMQKTILSDIEVDGWLYIVDPTDTTESAQGTSKRVLKSVFLAEQDQKIVDAITDSTLIGGVTTSSSVPPTGNIHAIGVGEGTYTNWGGMIVPANNFGTLQRVDGVYSVSLTEVDLSSKLNVSDLSSNLNSTSTTQALNLAGAKVLNDKKASLVAGKNKYNYLNHSLGGHTYTDKAIDNLGVISSFAGWVGAEIPILPSTTYSFKHNNNDYSDVNVGALAYLDANKVLLSYINMETLPSASGLGGKKLTTPVNTAYIFKNVVVGVNDYLVDFQLELGTSTTTFQSYYNTVSEDQLPLSILKASDIVDNLNSIETEKALSAAQGKILNDTKADLEPDKNKFNPALIEIDKFIEFTDVAIVNTYVGITAGSGWKISGFQEVLPDTIYTISGLGGYNKRLMFYDASLAPIGTICKAINSTFTTPLLCQYVNWTIKESGDSDSIFANCQLELGSYATAYEPYTLVVPERLLPSSVSSSVILIPKKIVFMGDSITADPSWWTANLLQKVSFLNFLNLARSGATWSHESGTVYDITSTGGSTTSENVIWNQVNKLIDKVTNSLTPTPDVVCILAGTNDYARTIGSASSAFSDNYPITGNAAGTILDVSTAVRYCCELILTNYPSCQIILVTPLQRGQEDNSVIFNIGQAIKDCGEYLAAQVIDAGKESGIYGKKETNLDIFLYDNLHPNAAGNEKIGAFMAMKLKNIINI